MASASSQALPIKLFVCGMPLRERQRQTHLLDTQIRSALSHSRQMDNASSQALSIKQFVCGMPRRERQRRTHLLDTRLGSGLWDSCQMVSALSHQDMTSYIERYDREYGNHKTRRLH